MEGEDPCAVDVRYVLDDRRLRYRGNKGVVTAQPRPTYMWHAALLLREPYEWGRWHDARSIHRPSTGHGHAHVTRPPSAGAAAITQPPHTGGCCPLKRNGQDTDGLRGVRQSAAHRANCRTLAEESTVPRQRERCHHQRRHLASARAKHKSSLPQHRGAPISNQGGTCNIICRRQRQDEAAPAEVAQSPKAHPRTPSSS